MHLHYGNDYFKKPLNDIYNHEMKLENYLINLFKGHFVLMIIKMSKNVTVGICSIASCK